MIIYNVTIKVDMSIASPWLQWMKEEHIPAMIATGYFKEASILQLLEIDDSEGPTYAIQYKADTLQAYKDYIDKYSVDMRKESFEKWGDKFIAFRSVMSVVN